MPPVCSPFPPPAMPSAPIAPPPPNAVLVRAFLARVFGRRPVRLPGLHEATDWLGVRHACTHPPEREALASTAALNYACAVALFFERGDARHRPSCTLAHVAAAVSLVDHDAVLTALSADPEAARLVLPLLIARQGGDHGPRAVLLPETHALVADWHQQVDARTRAHVLAYFSSIA